MEFFIQTILENECAHIIYLHVVELNFPLSVQYAEQDVSAVNRLRFNHVTYIFRNYPDYYNLSTRSYFVCILLTVYIHHKI